MATAADRATLSSRLLGASLGFFGGPVGLAVTALAGGMAYLALRTTEAEEAQEAHRETMAEALDIKQRLVLLTGEHAKKAREERDAVLEAAKADVAAAEAALQAAQAEAKKLTVRNALLVSRTGVVARELPVLGDLGDIREQTAVLQQQRENLAELEELFGSRKNRPGNENDEGSGGGDGGAKAKRRLQEYLQGLREETA